MIHCVLSTLNDGLERTYHCRAWCIDTATAARGVQGTALSAGGRAHTLTSSSAIPIVQIEQRGVIHHVEGSRRDRLHMLSTAVDCVQDDMPSDMWIG